MTAATVEKKGAEQQARARNALGRFVAVQQAKGVEIEYLGNLVWSTITDCSITFEQMKAAMEAAGIDPKYLPRTINPRDAFRRAIKTSEVRNEPLDDPTKVKPEEMRYLNILPRQVRMDKDALVFQLVREVVDSKNQRLEYTPIVEYVLGADNALKVASMTTLDGPTWKRALALEDEYQRCQDHYDGIRVRGIVTAIIEECRPVSVRPSGGVYFVPQAFDDRIEALREFVSRIAEYGTTTRRSTVRTIPVVDASEQRDMITESLEEQVEGGSQALIEEMTALLKSGKRITTTVAQKFIERVRGLGDLTKTYEEMLTVQSSKAASAIEVARLQAQALLEKVEVDDSVSA